MTSRALTPAQRQRRRRERVRAGKAVVSVEIDHRKITTDLVDAGLLDEADTEDGYKVGEALSRAIAKFVFRHA